MGRGSPALSPETRNKRSSRLPLYLGGLFALIAILLGWAPVDREAWLMENVLALPGAFASVVWRRHLPFTTGAWCLLFLFLTLHEVGSHYTYSEVPFREWFPSTGSEGVMSERNHYDRLVHFGFGLLCFRPIAEIVDAVFQGPLGGRRAVSIASVVALSSLYELLEFAAARITDPELGIAFVGAQGDVWDAQKDMGLALGGSVIAALCYALSSRRFFVKASKLCEVSREGKIAAS